MMYLDNAATSRYKPQQVISEMEKQLKNSANAGRSGHNSSLLAGQKIEETRNYIKGYVKAESVVFTKNCTEALNLAIKGLKLSGHVVTSMLEHNSVLRPLTTLANAGLIKLTVLTPDYTGKISPKAVARAITPDTSLVAITHVSNVTGAVQPIYEIAEEVSKKGVNFLVDSAQSIGHLPIDMREGIDILCAPGHKGLHGPQGTGFLAHRKNLEITPILDGGTGTSSMNLIQPTDSPEGLESGTQNTPAIAGLLAGMMWTEKKKPILVERTNLLTANLIDGLQSINKARVYTRDTQTGVVAFNIKNMYPGEVADILNNEYDIAVRSGLHCAPLAHKYLGTFPDGAVRASIGYNNNKSDIERFLQAIKEISKRN